MLFWNTVRKQQPSYLCWICLGEEIPVDSDAKFEWIRHSCGCNLQIHKKCYLRYLYNLIDKSYIQEIDYDSLNQNSNTIIYDLRKIYLFDFIDSNKNNGSNLIWQFIPTPIKLVLNPYLYLINLPINMLKNHPLESYLDENLQNLHNLPDISNNKCPQCKKGFIPFNTHFIKDRSIILSIYYNIQTLIDNIVPIALTVATITNPTKLWLKLGLFQLRSIFPEHILRLILNISTTKALDVYGETNTGLRSISSINKILIFGIPIYFLSLVASSESPFDLPYTPLGEIQLIYPLLLSLRIKALESSSPTMRIISKCLVLSKISIWVYKKLVSPWLHRKLIDRWLVENASGSNFAKPVFNKDDPFNSNATIISQWFFKFYYSINSNYDEIFRSTIAWPYVSHWLTDNLLIKFSHWLYENQFDKVRDYSPDELKMCFNFISFGLVGITYRGINLMLSKLRIQEINKLNEVVDNILSENEEELT